MTVLVFRTQRGARIAVPLAAGNINRIEEKLRAKGKEVAPYCMLVSNMPSHVDHAKFVNHTFDEIQAVWEAATGVKWTEVPGGTNDEEEG